ncbi:MAG TPA: o-succinylbenzoate synthase, partial [Gemmatimonadales bacterium]|nr:o-succinylbenzoate synthase [Gemmatimonadales bacterium]
MRIAAIELFELTLPLVEPFIISGGTVTERRSLIVVLRDAEGHVGYGESPPFPLPFYSEETLASARDLLERVLLPRVLGAEVEDPESLDALLRPGIRGNPFARAGVETAGWALFASREGCGLADLLATRLGTAHSSAVPCGIALGIPPERSLDTLRAQVADAVARGFRRVKIKVMPGWDVAPVRAASDVLSGTGVPLTVDANGGYEWPGDEGALRALDGFGLLYIEQPLPPDELLGHAALERTFRTPICLDESLRDARAARQVLELDGPRIWNIKVHRVGGLTETGRIWRLAREAGVRLWAGTMPESGIGSQAALAAASLPGFDLPSDLEPSARWFGRNADVIK